MKNIYCLIIPVILYACGYTQDIAQKLDSYLSRPGAFNGSALVVYQGNTLLYKGYGYKNKPLGTFNDSATIFRIGSISKPFTATVIMRLEQDGRFYEVLKDEAYSKSEN